MRRSLNCSTPPAILRLPNVASIANSMKPTPKSSIRTVASPREALALATFFTIAHAAAAEAPPKKEDTSKKDKKKGQDGEVLDEITVAAARETPYNPQNVQSPKFTAPLLNTPQSVTVVPKEVYTQQAAQDLNDVLRNTPGITFQAGEGGNPTSADNAFRMRGFDASNSIFVDGVRDSGQQDRDIFNIEQVEIARGPAGADVGRTTAAGYINLTTKAPLLEQFVRGTTSYYFDETDADGNFRQTVDYNQPLDKIALPGSAFRFNGLFQEGGIIGRELAENNRWSIAPSFATGLGTDTRFIFQFQYTKQENIPDYGLVRAALDSGRVGGGSYTGLPTSPLPSVEQDTSYGATFAYEDVESTNATFRFERDLKPNLLLTNQLRFSHSERDIQAVAPTSYQNLPTIGTPPATSPNPDYLLVGRNYTGNERTHETISNLTTLRADFATGAVEHVLSAGLEATTERAQSISFANGVIRGVDLEDPDNSLPAVSEPTRSGARTISTIDTVSVNVFDTAKINEQWQVTGGLRAEYYELDYQSRAATGVDTRIKTDDFLVDWKLGVVYKPLPNGSVYVSYGHSEQNPGTNLNLSASTTGTGADNINGDPQESMNYEIGTKWNWFDDKLTTTLAVFRTEQENIGTASDAITGEITETGEQTVQGVEFSVTGQITENWAVFGGIGYADSENSNPTTAASDNVQLQWTPELSGNIWTTYRFPFGLTVGGGVRYSDETVRSTTSSAITNITGTDAYWIVDTFAAYEVTENLTIRFNVNNVFDEKYLASVNNNGNRYNPGAPRSYVVSADWKF